MRKIAKKFLAVCLVLGLFMSFSVSLISFASEYSEDSEEKTSFVITDLPARVHKWEYATGYGAFFLESPGVDKEIYRADFVGPDVNNEFKLVKVYRKKGCKNRPLSISKTLIFVDCSWVEIVIPENVNIEFVEERCLYF